MSFPFIFESNFEQGNASEWDSETDTGGQLDFPHYTDLARFPWPTAAPLRGAYCMRLRLGAVTTDAFLVEGDLDIAADANRFVRFYVWLGPDLTANADDTITLFQLRSAGATPEVTFGLRIVASTGAINFGIGETAPTSFGLEFIERGKWYAIELDVTLDDGGSDDGTVDLYVTPIDANSTTTVHASQVASLDQGAVIDGVLGIQGQLATTTGTILFDNLIFDDTRIYSIKDRFEQTVVVTKDEHVFVGHGMIKQVELLSGAGTDCVASIYDTDEADTNDFNKLVMRVNNTVNNEYVAVDYPKEITRGAYVTLEGTNSRAIITFCSAIAYGSDGAIRSYANVR